MADDQREKPLRITLGGHPCLAAIPASGAKDKVEERRMADKGDTDRNDNEPN